jgi:hypothetical protein
MFSFDSLLITEKHFLLLICICPHPQNFLQSYSNSMSFPTNAVFLNRLAEIDFLSVTALAETCLEFRRLIFDEIITLEVFIKFVRRNQYAFLHNIYRTAFSKSEMRWIYSAFAALQQRHGSVMFECAPDVVIALTTNVPSTQLLALTEYHFDWDDLPSSLVLAQTASSLERMYKTIFARGWLYGLEDIRKFRKVMEPLYEEFWLENTYRFLREEFMFAKQQIDLLIRCYRVARMLPRAKYLHEEERVAIFLKEVKGLRFRCSKEGLGERPTKALLLGYIIRNFQAKALHVRVLSESAFLQLFELPGWKSMWSRHELGRLLALGLSQYGNATSVIIDSAFHNSTEALLWLFLGAHTWYHEQFHYIHWDSNTWTTRRDIKAKYELEVCCTPTPGLERDYVQSKVESLRPAERIALVQNIIRFAPEFGVCRRLGATLVRYFIIQAPYQERRPMLCAMVEEIVTSRLQEVFEWNVHDAILEYEYRTPSKLDLKLPEWYADKLVRKDLCLYQMSKYCLPQSGLYLRLPPR